MQVKTQKQVMVLQNKAQKVADKLNEEVIFITKGVQHIQVQAGTAYQLNAKDFDAKKSSLIAKKVGDDLEVALEEGVIIFDNYFTVCATDLSCLVSLPTEDGGLYHIVADASFTLEDGTQIVYFYGEQSIVSTESSKGGNQSFLGAIEIIAAVAVVAVIAGSSKDDDDGGDSEDDENTNDFITDLGSSNNDGITSSNMITINDLKAGETWQYSIDSGVNFIDGKGNSFMLSDDTYAANVIQIRKLDAAGVTLSVTNVNETSSIVIDTTKSEFTSSATVNIKTDTPVSETIYTATTNEEKVTYTLKSGFQQEKFTIDNATGELKYKKEQTQVSVHKVTIIATDVAGNETEQLITVSVKSAILSTSVTWNGIGDDGKINADEMAVATLSGTVEVIGTASLISISSIVFKKDNVAIHTIASNLPNINSDNTWSLGNSNAWTSKFTQGGYYTITVNLSSNSGSIIGSGSTITEINTVKPAQPEFTLEDTGLADNDGITSNGMITISNLESNATWQYSISGDNGFIDGTGNSFTLADNTTYEANAIQIRQTSAAGNISDIGKNTLRIVIDNTNPIFDLQSATTVNARVNSPITTTVYDAQVTNLHDGIADEDITYSIEGTNADKFSITTDTGILTYKAIQTLVHDNDTVTIVATDVAGNKTEQLITVSVKVIGLSTSVVWSGIGDDNKINASEMLATTLSGTVAIIGTVTSINISSIVFKKGNDVVHTISANLPSVDADDNTWTLDNNDTWASQLTQGDYTVIVNLSGNGGSITDSSSITTTIDIVKPDQPAFDFVDTGLSNNDGITSNGVITVSNLEAGITWGYSTNGGTSFTNGINSSFTLNEGTYEANAIQIRQIDAVGNVSDISKITSPIIVDTTDPIFDQQQPITANISPNTPITTTVYDAQVTNLNGGTADEGITYSIKGTNADKFSITAGTGILTYKTIQTSVHDDTITIVATDIAGNKTEKSITVSVKNSAQGFSINGENTGDASSSSVSSAGDVNGDGLDDLIVGAYGVDINGNADAGRSYVVFGKINSTAINLSSISAGTGGFAINGENNRDQSGLSVSSAGDVNGDGLDDLIIGAFWANIGNRANAGKSYVVFGKTNTATINLSSIAAGTGGFVINGDHSKGYSGRSVSSAGDVNGDGLDDLIVGAHGDVNHSDHPEGKSYVVFGKKDNTNAVNLSSVSSGSGGFVINGKDTSSQGQSGRAVSSAGDVNGDGLDDLVIGAFGSDPFETGKVFVVFGKKDDTSAIGLSAIESGTGGFVINGEAGDSISRSVSSAGDVNGDGLDDLIIEASSANPDGKENAGRSFVVFGTADTDVIELSSVTSGTGGFVINGEKAGDNSGVSVSSAGDVNGDGLSDLIVGAYGADVTGIDANEGKSYVVFGKSNTNAVDLSSIASGTGGFVINGESNGDLSGHSVSSAGDVNGDGLDDLIVGAHSVNTYTGKSYVIFGKTNTEAVNLANISKVENTAAHAIDFQGDTNTDKNDTLTGTSADELFVAGLGDDILTGNGGADVFNAGAGDDTIIINDDNLAKLYSNTLASHLLARVDGGGNTDTLKLAGSNLNLNLTQVDNGRIQDIEIIDLTGSGDNTLKLNLNDLLDISSETNTLRVIGDSSDKVEATGFNKSTASDVANGITLGNVTYDVYINTSASTAQLWVDQDLTVV